MCRYNSQGSTCYHLRYNCTPAPTLGYRYLPLLPTATTHPYYPPLLPTATTYRYYLPLLPTATTYRYYLPLLPTATTYRYYLPLLPPLLPTATPLPEYGRYPRTLLSEVGREPRTQLTYTSQDIFDILRNARCVIPPRRYRIASLIN